MAEKMNRIDRAKLAQKARKSNQKKYPDFKIEFIDPRNNEVRVFKMVGNHIPSFWMTEISEKHPKGNIYTGFFGSPMEVVRNLRTLLLEETGSCLDLDAHLALRMERQEEFNMAFRQALKEFSEVYP